MGQVAQPNQPCELACFKDVELDSPYELSPWWGGASRANFFVAEK